MISVPKGHKCPLCPDHQDDEDEFVWSDLLQTQICLSCPYDIVNGIEGWVEAPMPEQYNHADTIALILQLTGLTFQQAKFKFMRHHVEEWSGSVPEKIKNADVAQLTDQELRMWNAAFDAQMVKLRSKKKRRPR